MKNTYLIFLVLTIVILSCTHKSNDTNNSKIVSNSKPSNHSKEKKNSITNKKKDDIDLDTEPPFKYPCKFEFNNMGEIRVSQTRCEEIICGKGWNSELHSCTWIYGEHIYNQFAPDSLVTDYRMHIVDLNPSEIILTTEFLNSKKFKENTIATTISDSKNQIFKTIWDPNKTGKYKKPKQWSDE